MHQNHSETLTFDLFLVYSMFFVYISSKNIRSLFMIIRRNLLNLSNFITSPIYNSKFDLKTVRRTFDEQSIDVTYV